MIYIVLDNQKASKTLSRPLHLKLKKIQGLFNELHRNLRTFQEKIEFKHFSRLCEPCSVTNNNSLRKLFVNSLKKTPSIYLLVPGFYFNFFQSHESP